MTSPSMVHRSGDTLVVRSVVSGDALYLDSKQDAETDTESNFVSLLDDEMVNGNGAAVNEAEEDELDLPQCKIKRNYTCTDCNFYSQNPRSYLYHLKDVHKQKIRVYECPNCLYASKHSQKLQRHVHMVHVMNKRGNKPVAKKKRPKKPAPPLININPGAQQGSKPGAESAVNGERLKCSICGFVAQNANLMSRHEKLVHLKKRFFRCNKCNYVTHMRARYTKHVKYHSMPMIKCDLCDFRTPYKWNLDRHYKNHTGDGAYKCSLCNFTADIKQSLTVHEMNHHVPPVGQAGTVASVARRRNKVGASDTLAQEEEIGHEEMELLRLEREGGEDGHTDFLQLSDFSLPMGSSTPKFSAVSGGNNVGRAVRPLGQGRKIKVTFKKLKPQPIQEHNERHNFQTDFIHPDDIIQHKNGNVYIKTIKCRVCSYKAAWEGEMARHESKVHGIQRPLAPKKVPRPIPNLIPIQNKSSPPPLTALPILRIPSVRHRTGSSPAKAPIQEQTEEGLSEKDLNEICAKSCPNSSLRDFASLMGGADVFGTAENSAADITTIKPEPHTDDKEIDRSESPAAMIPKLCTLNSSFKKKNSSFFDQLKEKLLVSTGDTCNLGCWCGHESKCLTEFVRHQKTHSEGPSGMGGIPVNCGISSLSSTRCQLCRQRCKTSADLMVHLQSCQEANKCVVSSSGQEEAVEDKAQQEDGEVSQEPELEPEGEMEVETAAEEAGEDMEIDKKDASVGEEEPDAEREMEVDRGEGEDEGGEAVVEQGEGEEEGGERSPHGPHPMENKVFVWTSLQEPQEAECEEECLQEMSLAEDDRSKSPTSESSLVGIETAPGYGAVMGSSQEGLTASDDKHPVKKVFKCPHCTFWASTASRFHVHIVGHLNKKPFECSLCSYRSNWRWDITKHIRLKSARDRNHESAGVLMTDETGRRNYSKYNKYLTLMRVHEPSAESSGSGRRTKGSSELVTSPTSRVTQLQPILPAPPKLVRVTDSITTPLVSLGSSTLRPPPPLRAAHLVLVTTRPQQLVTNAGLLPQKKPSLEGKKTLWKCKKCNFRVASRELVLAHVKEHYQQREVTQSGAGLSANTTPAERHCRLKHSGDVRVVRGGKSRVTSEKQQQEDEEDSQDVAGDTKDSETTSVSNAEVQLNEGGNQGRHAATPPSQGTGDGEKMMISSIQLSGDGSPTKRYKCAGCPYVSNSKSQFLYHKQFHRPRGAPFKCGLCSYNVTRRHLLHQHLRVHGILIPPQKSPSKQVEDGGEDGADEIEEVTIASPDLDTCRLSEIPLVWVSRDNKFIKMFKCRFCPHVNMRKANIHEHEKMHTNRTEDAARTDAKKDSGQTTPHIQQHHCPDCNYICNNAGVLSSHAKVHQGMYGQVHGLVDASKSDEAQIKELKSVDKDESTTQAQSTQTIALSDNSSDDQERSLSERNSSTEDGSTIMENKEVAEETKKDNRLMYFCSLCPARFLFEKELSIHLRFHEIRLPYHCGSCSYTARQQPHLLAHLKVHSEEYQERTNVMLSMFQVSPQHLRPQCAVVVEGLGMQGPTWVVVGSATQVEAERPRPGPAAKQPCKQYSCHLCPATFFKSIALQYHLSLHGGLGPHKCRFCDYAVKTYGNLVKHEMIHNNPLKNTSQMKGKGKVLLSASTVPLSGTDLFEHRAEAQKREGSMPKTNYQLSSYVQTAAPMHVDPQFGILMHGNPDFVYPTYLKNGRLKEKRYKCHKCPSAFEKREQYKVHLSLHGAKQRYKCEKCDYSVKYYANYIQHIRKHENNDQAMLARKLEMEQEQDENDHEVGRIPTTVLSDLEVQPVFQSPRSAKTICGSVLSNQNGPLQLSVADRQSLMLLQQRRIPVAQSAQEASEEAKKSFWCPHCPYNNARRDGVESHIKRHEVVSGVRGAFVCAHCDYGVPQQHFLREHNKLHFTPNRKQPEVFMKYSRVELWASESGKENVTDSIKMDVESDKVIIFQDLGSNKHSEDRFFPTLPEDADHDERQSEEKVYVNINTGEPADEAMGETSAADTDKLFEDCDNEKPKVIDVNTSEQLVKSGSIEQDKERSVSSESGGDESRMNPCYAEIGSCSIVYSPTESIGKLE